jgi:hypothetical protein
VGCLFADQKYDPDVPIDSFASKTPQVGPAALTERFGIVVGVQEDSVDFFPDLLFKTAEMSEAIYEILSEETLIGFCHLKTSS